MSLGAVLLAIGAVACSSNASPTNPGTPSPTNFTTAARVTDAITGAVLSGVTASGTDIAGGASGVGGTMTVGAVAPSVSARAVTFSRTGYVARTVAMKIPGNDVAISMVPTTFNLDAYDEMVRVPRLQRWTSAPPLRVLTRTLQFTSTAQPDAVAIDEVMSDAERLGLEADLSWALPLLTGNVFSAFGGITRETGGVGERRQVLNTGVITVGRYAGLTELTRQQTGTGYWGYSRWQFRTDGTVIGGTIMLDRDFDRSASVFKRSLRSHELGHALGYTHVTLLTSVMNSSAVTEPNTFDRQATMIAFQRPPGNVRPDSDPSDASLNRLGAAVWSRGEGAEGSRVLHGPRSTVQTAPDPWTPNEYS